MGCLVIEVGWHLTREPSRVTDYPPKFVMLINMKARPVLRYIRQFIQFNMFVD
jgi:hypothetical protein